MIFSAEISQISSSSIYLVFSAVWGESSPNVKQVKGTDVDPWIMVSCMPAISVTLHVCMYCMYVGRGMLGVLGEAHHMI